MARVVGIDLGTSTSAVAVMERGHAVVLSQDDRERIMPSVVSIDRQGRVTVGHSARMMIETDPEFTFTGLKRLLGRRHDDPGVAEWSELVGYEIAPGPNGEAWVRGPDRLYSPIELLSHVLRKLREVAQATLGEPVTGCVIGVPAHFDYGQKEAVRQVARAAGLDPLRLLPEPTAAAVAYGVDNAQDRTIAVYDLGGGTFDVSILRIKGERYSVVATAGDGFLGGEDFDARIVQWLAEQFRQQYDVNLLAAGPVDERMRRSRLRVAAERAKVELSSVEQYRITERFIATKTQGAGEINLDLDVTLDRETLVSLIADLVDRTKLPCREALRRAKCDPRDIDEVVLVGGMTRMPYVIETVTEIFGRTPARRIDPITAVALGCATQGAALAGTIKSLSLQERAPQSFGVEVGNGAAVPIIRAGKPLPARETVRFGLAAREADAAAIRICQGDLKMAADNRQVGILVLNAITGSWPETGEPLIDVTLDLDEDGILTASAVNHHSGATIEHRVHAETGMSVAEIEHLRRVGLDEEDDNGGEAHA